MGLVRIEAEFELPSHPRDDTRRLENLGPLLCAVVDGKDYDAGFVDGAGGDEVRVCNDQLARAWNPASSARHGEGFELLNGGDDLHRDTGGDSFGIGKYDVVVSLIQLPGRLVGPFNHRLAQPVVRRRFATSSWLVTRPCRISFWPLRSRAS